MLEVPAPAEPAVLPPVPRVLDEPVSAEPAALPPVPTVDPVEPPPAELPPVPRVLDEPEPAELREEIVRSEHLRRRLERAILELADDQRTVRARARDLDGR